MLLVRLAGGLHLLYVQYKTTIMPGDCLTHTHALSGGQFTGDAFILHYLVFSICQVSVGTKLTSAETTIPMAINSLDGYLP